MKTVAVTGVEACEVLDLEQPKASGNFVVVKIMVSPMCTEYKAYKDGDLTDCLGHEAVGEVVDAGESSLVKAGDRVVAMPLNCCGKCNYCESGEFIYCQNRIDPCECSGNSTGAATYSQYLVKEDWMLVPIPEDISYDEGAMMCCGLGPSFGAMQQIDVVDTDTILIAGLGPVGLGGVINASYRGARAICIEGNPYRQELAMELGAAEVIAPGENALERILELTDGAGADKAIDCSGVAAAQRLLIDGLRRRGKLAFIGETGSDSLDLHVSPDMIRKGLTLQGNWHYPLTDVPELLKVIRASKDKIAKLVTHHFPIDQVQDAWELQLTGQCGKVMLDPWTS